MVLDCGYERVWSESLAELELFDTCGLLVTHAPSALMNVTVLNWACLRFRETFRFAVIGAK